MDRTLSKDKRAPYPFAASETDIREVGSNNPILLIGTGDSLRVVDGHVDVFAVEVEGVVATGMRYPIYRARAGDVVFGLCDNEIPKEGPDGQTRLALLAVGTVGTRVQVGFDLDGMDPSSLGERLDRFVAGLLRGIEQDRPAHREVVVEPGMSGSLKPGEAAFATGRRPVWLAGGATAESGDRLLLQDRLAGRADCLPVTASSWVGASEFTDFNALDMATLIDRGQWRPVLNGFLEIYQRALSDVFSERDDLARRRLERVVSAEGAALDRSIRDLAAMLGRPAFDLSDIDFGGNGLHAAFRVVLKALGVGLGDAPRAAPPRPGIDPLENLSLSYRVRTRKVLLRDAWWHHDNGPLLGFMTEGGEAVALIPDRTGGYVLIAGATGRPMKVDRTVADGLSADAMMVYRPLPATIASLRDILDFILPSLKADFRRIALMGLCGGVIAAMTPVLTGHLIETVLPRADFPGHLQIVLALVFAGFGAASFEAVKIVALLRVEGRADLVLQSSLFDRLLRLPTHFLKRFTTGDLTDRVLGIQTIRQTLSATTVQSLLGAVFSIFSLALLFYYNWRLAILASCMIALSVAVVGFLGHRQLVHERARIAQRGRAEGFVLQVLSAIGKLRVAGAEKRAYARWAGLYAAQKRCFVQARALANMQTVFQSIFPVLATGAIFAVTAVVMEDAAQQQQLDIMTAATGEEADELMSTGDFVAFNAAFGQLMLSMTALVSALTRALVAVPMFERLHPVIEEPLEESDGARAAVRLRGAVDISNVSYRYSPDSKLVLDDVSLSIDANEFIAIVGPSGSGKSTLVRLMLGFAEAESGEVLFDGIPLHSLELSSLRRQMQVVLQQGRLSGGSIFANIAGNGTLTEEDAWRAARMVGLAPDIEAMPMGMHSVVTEGVNTLSGGQRQRLLLARALAQHPTILVLDEPTSALDNTTQDLVMNSLRHLTGTRIVIAHRLSTVRHVDRILVMDRGRVVQHGRFEALLAEDGLFAEIAKRQMI